MGADTVVRGRTAVVTTGGTIEALGPGPHDLDGYMHSGRALAPGALLDAVPSGHRGGELVHVPFRSVPSPSVTDRDWRELAQLLDTIADDVDGIVVTHGTNTLEETAWFLELIWDRPTPLVLTGAMRPASALSADGPRNVANAASVAAEPGSRGRGVLVVMGTLVLSARDVTKVSTDQVDAFAARHSGPVGYVDLDGRVRFTGPGWRRPVADPSILRRTSLPRVDVITSYANADGVTVDALVAAGAQGIVSAGTGAGHPSDAEIAALRAAQAAGTVICRATRVPRGAVLADREYPGWVAAGRLSPWQARTLLSVALVSSRDPAALQDVFDRAQHDDGGADR